MGDYSKYIIVKEAGHEIAILFDSLLNHDVVAEGLAVVSAGQFSTYIMKNGVEVTAFGDSTTLELSSRKEVDAEIIKKMLTR